MVRRQRELHAYLRSMAKMAPGALDSFLRELPAPVRRAVFEEWFWQAHGGQKEPPGGWGVWLIQAGRGFGKTRAGAEWAWARARAVPGAAIALVGANLDDVRKVMVEGESGIAAAARTGEEARWLASRNVVEFSTGAIGFAYSGERPDKLRGPQHHFAWCDELAKYGHAEATWNNLRLTMRLGERPRIVVTTTPRPMPLLKRIRAEAEGAGAFTGGRTAENLHLPDAFHETMAKLYGGTRLGRQELEGELIEDIEGTLFPRAVLERARIALPAREALTRVVVGVDPPASATGDACGIVVCARMADGGFAVLGDYSMGGLRPEGWARAVHRAAEIWGADRVIAEKNQGGDMVDSVLRSAGVGLPVKMAPAVLGKAARAEPIAVLFERGEAKLAGAFPELEDELAGLTASGGYGGPGRSPDRADACVWAMSELQYGVERGPPRIRAL